MGVNNLTWISKGNIQDACQFGEGEVALLWVEAWSVIECCESTSIRRNQRNCEVHILSVLHIPIPGSHQLWPMLATCIRMPKFSIFSHPTHSSNVLICKIRLGRLNWYPNASAQEINHDNSKILYQYQSAWLIYFHAFHNADSDSFFSGFLWLNTVSIHELIESVSNSFSIFKHPHLGYSEDGVYPEFVCLSPFSLVRKQSVGGSDAPMWCGWLH